MKSKSKLVTATRVIRLTLALTAVGYVAWSYWHQWQQQNQAGAQIWAAGTDRID
jgi:uncharacterized membrane protein YebE (DUF533 family)